MKSCQYFSIPFFHCHTICIQTELSSERNNLSWDIRCTSSCQLSASQWKCSLIYVFIRGVSIFQVFNIRSTCLISKSSRILCTYLMDHVALLSLMVLCDMVANHLTRASMCCFVSRRYYHAFPLASRQVLLGIMIM